MHYLTSYHYPKIHWECRILGVYIDDIVNDIIEIHIRVSEVEWTNGTRLMRWNGQIFREGFWYIDDIQIILADAIEDDRNSKNEECSFYLWIRVSKTIKAALF